MIKAIIFDFDGVIVNSEPARMRLLKNLFTEWKIPFTDSIFELLAGVWIMHFLQKAVPSSHVHHVQKIHDEYYQRKHDLVGYVEPVAFIHDFIKANQKKYLFALATSSKKDYVMKILKRFDLDKSFDHIVTQEDVQNIKPDPEIYEKALGLLNVLPKEALAVEDSATGAKSAIAARIRCLVLETQYADKKSFDGLQIESVIHDRESLAAYLHI